MFEAQDPAMQQKAGQQGTRQVAIQMAGRRPFDPYRDRILNGLSSGSEIEVNSTNPRMAGKGSTLSRRWRRLSESRIP